MEIERFFDELAPRLETARVLEHELDRNLARRFNVLDYLRDDELGLSRVIADLLNPKASHGQGALFLHSLLCLEEFKKTQDWPNLDRSRISVVVERRIREDRRIDISVEIVSADEETYCLAIENKPYAGDQKKQIKDYLEFLKGKYDDRFLLIYLSPAGDGPSEESVPKNDLHEWNGRFAIMPYSGSGEEREDGFDDFRLRHSLAEWFGKCRKNCEVDRLRWFLRDAETFCQRTFGGQAMTTKSENRTVVQDFVLADADRLRTAETVYESWPAIKDEVCRQFFERLRSAIEKKAKESVDDIIVVCEYTGEPNYSNWISMYRECWAHYEINQPALKGITRTTIAMENQKKGPNGWCIGVVSPMSRDKMTLGEKKRRERLDEELGDKLGPGKVSDWWPWWNWVEGDKKDWNLLIPELHKECQDKDGEIIRYFVNTFTEIAQEAIPIINKIEKDDNKT